jgi:hypothetical protein
MATKFVLSDIATKFVNVGNASASLRTSREELRTLAATLSDKRKVLVDEEIVTYYAAKIGKPTQVRTKPSTKGYGTLTIPFDRDGTSITDPKQKAAQTAISELRALLFGRAATVTTSPVERAKESLAALFAKQETKAEARRAIKELVLLINAK